MSLAFFQSLNLPNEQFADRHHVYYGNIVIIALTYGWILFAIVLLDDKGGGFVSFVLAAV